MIESMDRTPLEQTRNWLHCEVLWQESSNLQTLPKFIRQMQLQGMFP